MDSGKEVLILDLDDVLPNRFQPRIKFNEQSILELAESIKEHGVIQPIVVRRIADKYEIIAGERRYKASVLAGKKNIPAIVTDLDDKNSAEVALIENVQRQDLTPIEEAISYKKILDMGYLNQATLAEKLGKTQSTIANKLRLLNLDDEVQEALLREKISERHARSLLKLEKSNQVKMLNRILEERMTVRKTDEEIMKLFNRKKSEKTNVDTIQPVENNEFNSNEGMNVNSQPDFMNQQSFVPPIVDIKTNSVEPIEEIKPLVPNFSTGNSTLNPGFMDIDKIEAQAQDIFAKQPVEEVSVPPVKEEILSPVEPLQPIENGVVNQEDDEGENRPTGGRFFNMFNRQEENNPNYVSDIEEKEVNMNMEQPSQSVNSIFNFNPISQQPMEQNSNPTVSSVQTTVPNVEQTFVAQPNVNPSSMNPQPTPPVLEEKEDTFETVKPYTLTDDSDFTNPIIAPAEIVENHNISSMQSNPTIELQPKKEEEIETIRTADMKTVIHTVRDCVSQIENYGYVVDEDEVDLENSYQITITIDKR